MKRVLQPADLPELFVSLPPSFTFPLARIVMDYAGATNGFNIMMWRIHPILCPPPWMAECFVDWSVNILTPDCFPDEPLVNPSRTATHYGLLSSYVSTSKEKDVSTPTPAPDWTTILRGFADCLYCRFGDVMGISFHTLDYFLGPRNHSTIMNKWLRTQYVIREFLFSYIRDRRYIVMQYMF